jgi:ring-1,2-phenylacetyl-CoA epoxidase subunit PaaE
LKYSPLSDIFAGQMQHSYPIKIKEVRRETDQCVSIALEIPEDQKELFRYTPGQYINLIKNVDGEELHRSYSLCSSPVEQEWRVAVKQIEGGAFSTYANKKLKAGDIIEVMPPNGKFTSEIKTGQAKSYLFLAAGSGITPIISLVKTILKTEKLSQICLIYGNQKTDQIIFLEELMGLKNLFIGRLSLYFILSRELMEEPYFNGRICREKLELFKSKLYEPNDVDEAFICGPEEMILETRATLEEQGIALQRIHVELFGTKSSAKPTKFAGLGSDKESSILLKTDGRTVSFNLPFNSTSLLDGALKNKVNLPYACKGGVCCTCKAKLLEGEVEMVRNYGLEPEEIEAGYILTCQSFPKSAKISVDFDQ